MANGEVVFRDEHGTEVSRATSDAGGVVGIGLPAGVYIVEALPAEGLMGTPVAVAVAVAAAAGGAAELFLAYDTGTR